jgi:hypothetical protein
MRLFFVDESGTAVKGDTEFLVLGGVIIRGEDWVAIRDKLDRLKSSFGINANIEVKWRHVRHPGGSRNPLRALSDGERTQFGRRMLGIVRETGAARVIGIVIDKAAAFLRPDITNAEELYKRSVTLAMERFQYYLRATRDVGIVVQDHRLPNQDARLRAFYRTLLTTGTRWTRFPSIVESVFLTPSDFSTGIQLADFICGSIYASHCSAKPDEKYFNVIRGKITGDRRVGKRHGFKMWP